jgi:uncharacterized protein YjiS (DUF1127 family)
MTKIGTQTLAHSFVPGLQQQVSLAQGFKRVVSAAFETLLTWQQRSFDRGHLASLDHRLIQDMAMTRSDVAYEVAKPVWRS